MRGGEKIMHVKYFYYNDGKSLEKEINRWIVEHKNKYLVISISYQVVVYYDNVQHHALVSYNLI